MKIEKMANIMRTENYSIFKHLDGNRAVLEPRINKITSSIQKNGYILNPICVNEKMEIVDGQGRFESLKRLKMPIDYYVVKGVGIKECIAMNLNQSNWKVIDYIECFAQQGIKDYQLLLCLHNAYIKSFPITIIFNAVVPSKSFDQRYSISIREIAKGNYKCSEEQYEQARNVLEWLLQYADIGKTLGNAGRSYLLALQFIKRNCNFSEQRLYERLTSFKTLNGAATIKQAMTEIEELYNYRSKTKVYFANDYQRWLDSGKGKQCQN